MLQLQIKKLGEDHPDVGVCLNNLANLYYFQGKYDAAEPLYHRVLKIMETKLGSDHPSVATAWGNLANIYANKRKYAKAELMLDRTISIQSAKGIDKGTLSNSYRLRAKIAWQQEDRDKAIFALHEAMRLAELQRTQFSGAAQDHANAFSSFGYTYELMVAYQTILGNVPEVFSTMERGRAKSLLDQLAVSGTDLLAGLPADEAAILHKRDVDAKSRLASLEQQLKVNGTRIDYSDEKKIMEGKRQFAFHSL